MVLQTEDNTHSVPIDWQQLWIHTGHTFPGILYSVLHPLLWNEWLLSPATEALLLLHLKNSPAYLKSPAM